MKQVKDNNKRGWLYPDGEFVECDYYNFTHFHFAKQYYAEHNLRFCLEREYIELLVKKLGFVKVGDWSIEQLNKPYFCLSNFFSLTKEITQEQYEWLVKNKPYVLSKYFEEFYK